MVKITNSNCQGRVHYDDKFLIKLYIRDQQIVAQPTITYKMFTPKPIKSTQKKPGGDGPLLVAVAVGHIAVAVQFIPVYLQCHQKSRDPLKFMA